MLEFVWKFYLQLKNRCVDGLSSMAFEAASDDVEDFLPDGHLLGIIVPCSLKQRIKMLKNLCVSLDAKHN